MAFIPSR